jgi:hypothetical protein
MGSKLVPGPIPVLNAGADLPGVVTRQVAWGQMQREPQRQALPQLQLGQSQAPRPHGLVVARKARMILENMNWRSFGRVLG